MAKEELESLKCMATNRPFKELEDTKGNMMVFVANKNGAVTAVGLIGGDTLKDAKTVKIVLSKSTPDANFQGLSYQCIESFK